MYATREQIPTEDLYLVVRASLNPTTLQESIRKAVSAFDHDQALTNIQTLEQVTTDDTASDPCGTGPMGMMGPMMTQGYMMGTLTVQ